MDDIEQVQRLENTTEWMLGSLTKEEETVLRHSFGIQTEKTTDVEIAKTLQIEPVEVDAYRVKALRKLRHPSRADCIESFFDTTTRPKRHPVAVVPKAVEEIKTISLELLDHLRRRTDDIKRLRPEVFEHVVGELLASRGFTNVEHVGRNQNTSADLLAARYVDDIGVHRYFVEIKRWKNKIGVEVIDRVYGALIGEKPKHGWTAAMIVSIVGFKNFKKYTRQDVANLGIYLKDRDDLLAWLSEYEESPNGLWLPPES